MMFDAAECCTVRPGTLGYQRCVRLVDHPDRHRSQDGSTWMDVGYALIRRDSKTGAMRGVCVAAEVGIDADDKWLTTCETHSTFASSPTRAAAEAAHTDEFCEKCSA